MSTELGSPPAVRASSRPSVPRWLPPTWAVFIVAALLLPVLPLAAWGVVILVQKILVLWLATRHERRAGGRTRPTII